MKHVVASFSILAFAVAPAAARADAPNVGKARAAIRADLLPKLRTWSPKPPHIEGFRLRGNNALVWFNTGESGGAAIYSLRSGSWRFRCQSGGALDAAVATSTSCGLSARDAATLLRSP